MRREHIQLMKDERKFQPLRTFPEDVIDTFIFRRIKTSAFDLKTI